MTTIVQVKETNEIDLYCKGAPNKILNKCKYILTAKYIKKM